MFAPLATNKKENNDHACECNKNSKSFDPSGNSGPVKNSLLWKAFLSPQYYANIFPYSSFPMTGGVSICKATTIPITTNDKGAAYFSLNAGVILTSQDFDSLVGATSSQFAPYRWATSNLPSAAGFVSNPKNALYDGSSSLTDNSNVVLASSYPFNPTDETAASIIGIKDLSFKKEICNAYYYSFLTRIIIRETSSLTDRQGLIDVGTSISFASDLNGSPYNINKLKPDLVYSDYNTLKDLTNSKTYELGNKISVTMLPPDNESMSLKASSNVDYSATQRLHVIFHGCQPNTTVANIEVIQPFIIVPNKELSDLGLSGGNNLNLVSVSDYTTFMHYLSSNDLLIRTDGINNFGFVLPDKLS